jgi:hypothetical protein
MKITSIVVILVAFVLAVISPTFVSGQIRGGETEANKLDTHETYFGRGRKLKSESKKGTKSSKGGVVKNGTSKTSKQDKLAKMKLPKKEKADVSKKDAEKMAKSFNEYPKTTRR